MNDLDPTFEYNLEAAVRVIKQHTDLGDMDVEPSYNLADRDDLSDTGHHYFEWGHTDYSQWQVESSWAWVAELAPIRDDSGSVVDYVVIEIERVE